MSAIGNFARAVVICSAASMAPAAWAGDVRIMDGASIDQIILETKDATADEILNALAARFEFTIERTAEPSRAMRFSGRLQGSLDRLLERVLRHEGHMIVRSSKSKSGISQVVMLEAKANIRVAAGPNQAPAPAGSPGPLQPAGTSGPADAQGQPAPAAPSAVGAAPATEPGSVQPVADASQSTDSTLRQLHDMGRQLLSMNGAGPGDAANQSPAIAPAGASSGGGYENEAQRLTQQAVANVQSLVTSLRGICLGSTCAKN